MSYNANGGITIAEWSEVKKLVNDLSKLVNQKLSEVNADTIQNIRENITALQLSITAINSEQSIQNSRLDNLEDTAANTEITPTEVQQMWGA